jgi:hypothetical protein
MTTQEWLTKMGIPTLFTNITVLLSGATPQTISQQMQKSVGRIYGISVYTDTVTYNNQPLISSTDCTNLYLTFVKGTNQFAGRFRFDDFNYNAVTLNSPINKYLEINLPGAEGIDLDKSFIDNPTAIAAKNVSLNLWYIDKDTYEKMETNGLVFRNGISMKK